MFDGKMKAVTFSYDDGVTQDERLIELMNKYGLKSTFNINSELLGKPGVIRSGEKEAAHNKVAPEKVKDIYKEHEVAVHTLTHPNLTQCTEDEIIRQVEQDRLNLEKLAGYPIVGMAYPCGGVNNDERVAKIIKESTGVKYSRTITCNSSFDPQNDLYRFDPTAFHCETEKLYELWSRFMDADTQKPQLFYIWGHSYELDLFDGWDTLEDFFKLISGREDVFYGTNREVFSDKL